MELKKKILFISGSLGLGHITRDIAIANQLRKLIPDIDIEWLAADPATQLLFEANEKLAHNAEFYANENIAAEKAAKGTSLNLLSYLIKAKHEWKKNIDLFLNIIKSNNYDLVIGDETYEINLAMREHKELKNFKYVMIFDFVGLDAMTKNPLERLGVYYWNKVWCSDFRKNIKPPYDLALFVGELQDVPNNKFGFNLPNRRIFAKSMYTFIGYVFPFSPNDYSDKQLIRDKLGYSSEPLVIVSIGGTAIGKELLELCGEAASIVNNKNPNINFIFVTGPRLEIENLKLPNNIKIVGYLPRLYEHFAASDLAIVQGGATSTFELTVLRKSFIYFPIEGHCEQANVSRILNERGAGIPLSLSKTTPELLAEKILSNIGRKVSYPIIPANGAEKAAHSIIELITKEKV